MLASLRSSGFARLPPVPWIGDTMAYLRQGIGHPGHVKARPRPGIFCNSMKDVMAAPHFLDYAKGFTSLAGEYFGEPAHLWSLNCFYTGPDTPYVGPVNGLHVDREAPKILVLFVLGEDTGPDGAQLLLTRENTWAGFWGPAGTACLADTTLPHCGLLPRAPRSLLWARWADRVPEAARDEGLPTIP
jgi:hypothetical protein